MDMNTELVCVIASLGYFDDDDYFKGEDCLPSLKDLVRFLRHEDESCNIRRQMGNSQLLQKDLLPLFIYHGDDLELIDIVVRLLVNLTSPADICFNKNHNTEEGEGKEKFTNTFQSKYLEVVGYLQSYKEAFASEKAMGALAAQLGKILQMEWEDRGDDEFLLFERLLLLLRNLLHVPSSPDDEKRTDDDASLHDQLLWSMHLNGIDDLLIYICSSPDESRWAMHAIEIVHLMLREQNPEGLAQTSEQRSDTEKNEDARALMLIKEREEAKKKNNTNKVYNSRHSRFGGSFWVQNMKGVGMKNTLVHHKHVQDSKDISFDDKKYKARVPIRKREAQENLVERKSTLSIRLLLKTFCNKFLEECYNHLMRHVKDNIVSKRSQDNDETFYLWSIRFFMAFNRVNSFKVEFVSETLNMNVFYYILKQVNHYYDHFFMHKRGGWEPWQRRLHYGIQSYKELLTYIANMDSSTDHILKDASSIIKNNVFYHEEYRSIFLVLIRHYDSHKQTRKYLADLIDTFHIFLKMLEKFCSNKGAIVIKTKKKKSKPRRKKRPTRSVPQMSNEQLEGLWEDDIAPSLSSILQGNESIPEDIAPPFDPASDVPDDEQRLVAVIRAQDGLKTSKYGEAIAIIRASREFWPDDATFGREGISPEDEFMLFRNLLFQEFERPAHMGDEVNDDVNEEEDEELGEEEEEESNRIESVEREFNIQQFLNSLASPQILMPYSFLLRNFEKNTTFTNHAIIKMMHRIAVDLKFPEMFYQLSLFITFKEILDVECSQFKELCKFAKYITNKFITIAMEKPAIFVEALFWKGTGDCYQISEREDQIPERAKPREKWSFEDEEELKKLYEEYRDSDDVVGDILKSVTDKDRTRRQISNKLVRMRLVDNARDLPRPKKPKARDWTEDQTDELHRLYEEFKETDDIIDNIMIGLTSGKSKKVVIEQLIETGKISDRSELIKKKEKRRRKRRNENFKSRVDGSDGENNGESCEDENENNLEDFLESQRNHSNGRVDSNVDRDDDANDITLDDTFIDDLPPNPSIGDLVCKLKEIGFSQQIVWLQTRLTREAEGREEDNEDEWYATPLLTMTDEDEKAMKNKIFRKLIRKIGLKPPEDFNVATWWTIPPALKPTELRQFVNQIENPIASRVKPDTSVPYIPTQIPSTEKGTSSTGTENSAVTTKSKKLRKVQLDSDSEEESDPDSLIVDKSEQSSIKSRKTKLIDSESEDEVESTNTVQHSIGGTKRRSVMLQSDSEDEHIGTETKRTRMEESDANKPKMTEISDVNSLGQTEESNVLSDDRKISETEEHDQSALNFSLRLSEEEEEEEEEEEDNES